MAEKTAEEKVVELQGMLDSLQENYDQLEGEKKELLREVMEKKSTIKGLQGELTEAKKTVSEKETSAASQLQDLKVKNSDLLTQLEALSKEKEGLQKKGMLDEAIRKVGLKVPEVYIKTIDTSAITKPEEAENAVRDAANKFTEDLKARGIPEEGIKAIIGPTVIMDGKKPHESEKSQDFNTLILRSQGKLK